MNGLTAALLVWTLISPSGGGHGGRGEIWPTHVACRNEGLEVFYQSCDPLQDFGFSVDQCSKKLQPHLSIRFGIILREDIRELFLDVLLLTKGASVLNFSYPICEDDLPKFSFCGRRKGDLDTWSSEIGLSDTHHACCMLHLQGTRNWPRGGRASLLCGSC
nr:lymphocyte antigen 86 isoform X3 [Marmota flaviventris]